MENTNNNNGKGLSIAGLVLGIVAVVFCWLAIWNTIALVCAIVGLICAIKGKKLATESGEPTGIATAGLVLSIIGLVFAGIGFLTCTVCSLCIIGSAGSLGSLM